MIIWWSRYIDLHNSICSRAFNSKVSFNVQMDGGWGGWGVMNWKRVEIYSSSHNQLKLKMSSSKPSLLCNTVIWKIHHFDSIYQTRCFAAYYVSQHQGYIPTVLDHFLA